MNYFKFHRHTQPPSYHHPHHHHHHYDHHYHHHHHPGQLNKKTQINTDKENWNQIKITGKLHRDSWRERGRKVRIQAIQLTARREHWAAHVKRISSPPLVCVRESQAAPASARCRCPGVGGRGERREREASANLVHAGTADFFSF